jgi:hypothetical protein
MAFVGQYVMASGVDLVMSSIKYVYFSIIARPVIYIHLLVYVLLDLHHINLAGIVSQDPLKYLLEFTSKSPLSSR